MKKSILSAFALAALLFATQSIQAQEEPIESEETQEINTETKVNDDGFEVMDVLALPQPIKDATMADFNAVASEAWVKTKQDQKIYKLKVSADNENKIVFANAKGEWLKEDEVIE